MTSNDTRMTIEHFMWGYQIHFRISAKVSAESVFNLLDLSLKPTVFLVGILVEDKADRYPACVEPEESEYKPDLFNGAKELSKHYAAVDPDKRIFHSHPIAQAAHENRMSRKALQKAILDPIVAQDSFKGVTSYASWPVMVEGYMVSVILQLDRKVLERHYSLTKDLYDERYWIAKSLIDAAANEFLDNCSRVLTEPNPGASSSIHDRGADELLRSAAKTLMYTPASAGGEIEGLHGLFDAVNKISSLKYEGEEGIGSLMICRKGHPNLKTIMELSTPVPMTETRAVRKLLQTSSSNLHLLSNSATVFASGELSGLYDHHKEDLFNIRFIHHHDWELLHDGHPMMRVIFGEPRLPRPVFPKLKFEDHAQRCLPAISESQTDRLWEIVMEATKQKKGALIVVTSGAKEEADRLGMQATQILPITLTPDLVSKFTSIDGAILISQYSVCYAIGVILDGLASPKGSSARGARYNSAIRYIHSSKHKCLAMVISEDGIIDIVPDLKPRIKKSLVENMISEMRQLNSVSTPKIRDFYQIMGKISDYSFYLYANQCKEINSLRREIEGRFTDSPTIRIVYQDFYPNDELNDSYFFNE